MPDKPASERTEKATPERLKKGAAEQGQVAQSAEVPSALMIAMLFVVLALMSGQLYHWFVFQLNEGLSLRIAGAMTAGTFAGILQGKGLEGLSILAPFLIAAVAVSVGGSMLVGGWTFSPKALRLDLSRISPMKGIKNLISLRGVVQLLVATAKLAVILAITWKYLGGHFDTLLSLHWTSPEGTLYTICQLIFGLGGRIAAALLAIAGADMLYQRWNHKRQLRMTREEIKEERKRYELAPEIKGRLRSLQMAMSRKRMLQEVPKADVIVTNPTHYAVALRYDAKTMNAPTVVAKGSDFLCEKIKEIAREHNVPIIEKPRTCPALYAAVEPGEAIPETLFIAVAELLALIYRLRNRNRTTW